MIVDCGSDDDIRFSRIILSTLNLSWAQRTDICLDDRLRYGCRYSHFANVVDMHQNKDRSSEGEFLPLIADMSEIERI